MTARTVTARDAWRWFPHAMIGSILVVFAVNGAMVYAALSTFPGQAGEDGFDLSNGYARVQDLAAEQAALGWRLALEADPLGRIVLLLIDKDGSPLPDAVIAAAAERPVGPKAVTPLLFDGDGGRLVSRQALASGRWSVRVTAVHGGRTLTATRHLVVR